MKQLLQNLNDGKSIVADIPAPEPRKGTALVRTAASLVSAGTERMVVDFAAKSLFGKAASRPDLVRQMLEKARREGILTTLEAARNRLNQPMALGYSSSGSVVAVGEGLTGFKIGDRVACAGAGYAVHAEYAVVPKNLLIPIPERVDFESAAFATLGAIALHGFRLAQPQLGEKVAVIGLGLLGLLAAGIARAAGCEVLGIDLDPHRLHFARQMGAAVCLREVAVETGEALTRNQGFDSVLICADAPSNDPVELAGILCRDRGKVVAVGAVGMEIPRKLYYEKELSFIVSRSYGPGRYDPNYEENGQDYPIGYVRWSEGRNLEAFIDLLADGKLDLKPLISHRFPIQEAVLAYDLISGKQRQPYLGVLITYPQADTAAEAGTRIANHVKTVTAEKAGITLGVLGAGNYASAVFLPIIKKTGGVTPHTIVSASGLTARRASQRYGYAYAGSSELAVLEEPGINLVAILTRHHHHARQTCLALENHKHVYCEKPLAVNQEQLEQIFRVLGASDHLLMAGFNRRFAPHTIRLKAFLEPSRQPFSAHYRINAGYLPLQHWLHDPEQGGGRIIGEACHFIDLLTFLAGAPPVTVSAAALPDEGRYRQDNVLVSLAFPDGSIGSIAYLANGDRSFSKERLEVFCGGRIAVLDDFRKLELVHDGRSQMHQARLRQDKGHGAAWLALLNAIQDNLPPPIPYPHLWGVTQASFAVMTALKTGATVTIPAPPFAA